MPEHRDFAPWNVLLAEDGTLGVTDWESAVVQGLPVLDLWYFLTYLALAVERQSEDRLARNYETLMDPGSRTGRVSDRAMSRYLDLMGLHRGVAAPLRALTWMVHIPFVVSDGFPYPLTSGRIRQYHMISGLARHHRVTLVAAVPTDQPAEHADALAGRVNRIVTVPSLRLSRGVLRKATGRLLPRSTRDIERAITNVDREERIDRVLNARLPLRFSEVLPDVPVVTDLCDAVPDGIRDRLRVAAPLDRPLLVAKHRDALRSEARMVDQTHEVVFASARDEAVVARRRPLPHVTIVPNGVDAAYWKRRESTLGIRTVVFAGAMPYAPNEDAALYLLADVMPRIWEHRPDTRLVIAGRDPGPRLVAAAALDERVEVTGYVEDLRPQLERAAVVVAPLRFATGIQNKILEAMAKAIPVVTTPVGEAGLLIPGELAPPISVAADAVGLAAAIVGKLDAAKRDPTPDAVARGWVMERFRWGTAIDRIDRLLDRARSTRR